MAGYDPDVDSVWVAEGLLFYLPEALAQAVLSTAARLATPGSCLVCDLIGTGIFRFPYTQDYLRRLEQAGTPWLFGTDNPVEFLASCGWRAEHMIEPGDEQAHYGRWPHPPMPHDMPDLPHTYLITATKTE